MELSGVLPQEIVRQCLLRVPYHSHEKLRAVCKSWEGTVKQPDFYEDRKKVGASQKYICLLELRQYRNYRRNNLEYVASVFDPLRGTLKTLPPFPYFPKGIPLFCDCVCVNEKLVLMSGRNPLDYSAALLNTVFIYDFTSGEWSRGADMPVIRVSCACAVSPDGLVYVAGGHDDSEEFLRSAAIYNVSTDEWKLLPEMTQARAHCYGVFIHGKFFVISGYSDELGDELFGSVEVYDPETGSWTTLENMWTVREVYDPEPCVVASSTGRLFLFQMQQGVMEYDSNENVWRAVGSVPETFKMISSCVAWSDKIFVGGYGEGYQSCGYMFEPPPIKSAAGAQEETIGKWVALDMPDTSHVAYGQRIESALTFEI